jgi:ribosomal protein S18 acetylase RimI-like enzyme
MASDETFFGFDVRGEVVAALSYKRDDEIVDIHRLMVHPNHFRKGIANQLLADLEKVETGVQKIIVSTGSSNKPAVNLYKKLGFKEVGEIVVGEGVSLSQFLKTRG